MANTISGYSKTPLAKKLGLKPGMSILVIACPKPYGSYFNDFPAGVKTCTRPQPESVDFIHIFCTDFTKFVKAVHKYKPALKKSGLMWISWPKGSSKLHTNIKRDPVREHVLAAGLVDTKVCAIDQDWSGLKFVYRLKDR